MLIHSLWFEKIARLNFVNNFRNDYYWLTKMHYNLLFRDSVLANAKWIKMTYDIVRVNLQNFSMAASSCHFPFWMTAVVAADPSSQLITLETWFWKWEKLCKLKVFNYYVNENHSDNLFNHPELVLEQNVSLETWSHKKCLVRCFLYFH